MDSNWFFEPRNSEYALYGTTPAAHTDERGLFAEECDLLESFKKFSNHFNIPSSKVLDKIAKVERETNRTPHTYGVFNTNHYLYQKYRGKPYTPVYLYSDPDVIRFLLPNGKIVDDEPICNDIEEHSYSTNIYASTVESVVDSGFDDSFSEGSTELQESVECASVYERPEVGSLPYQQLVDERSNRDAAIELLFLGAPIDDVVEQIKTASSQLLISASRIESRSKTRTSDTIIRKCTDYDEVRFINKCEDWLNRYIYDVRCAGIRPAAVRACANESR